MGLIEELSHLRKDIIADTEILTEQDGELFVEHAKRWTDIGRQTPGAILLPTSEIQIQTMAGEGNVVSRTIS